MIRRIMLTMIEYFGQDRQKINHALKVYGYARTIALSEGMDLQKLRVLECAAILHDIGIPESMRAYGSAKGEFQEIMGVKVSSDLLMSLGCPENFITQVAFLIGNHHSYGVDGGMSLQILFEADFLVNLDESGADSGQAADTKEQYFKTKTGKDLINTLFGVQPQPWAPPISRR